MDHLKDSRRASHASTGDTGLPAFSDSIEVTNTEPAVTYVYGPAWRSGEHYVLGLLGRNRQATIAIVREAFDELKPYADDRFTLHAQHGERGTPVRIMDSVWSQVWKTPPQYIVVMIKKAPRDPNSSSNNRVGCLIVAVIVAILIFVAMT